jgi:anti-sigma factor RsiW
MHDLLPAYFDGELDADRVPAFEQHLAACPECARELETLQELRGALQDPSFRHEPPPHLTRRVRSVLTPRVAPRRLVIGLAAATILAAVGVAGSGVILSMRTPAAEDRLALEVAAGHARSLLAEHLLDVASSDRHTVKPWFQGRIDFAPPVKDLGEHGFALAGGRLDFVDGRTAAALIYRRRQHVINLFIWPAADGRDSAARGLSRRGYQLTHWVAAGLNFWAVSDLNAAELDEFARLVRAEGP